MKQNLKILTSTNTFIKLACVIIVSVVFNTGTLIARDYYKTFISVQKSLDDRKYDKALKTLKSISDAELKSFDDTLNVFYYTLLGKTQLILQHNDSALISLAHALDLYEGLSFKFPAYSDLLVYRAFASDRLGDREDAARWYGKALVKMKVLEHNPDLENCCFLNLGNIYNESGQYKLATDYYNKIHWIDTLQIVDVHVGYYGQQIDRYLEFARKKDWIVAKQINDSLTMYTRIKYGEAHSFHLSCLQSEATIEGSLQRYGLAANAYNEIVRIGKQNALISSDVGYAYIHLIEALCQQDKIDEAISFFQEAKEYMVLLKDPNLSIIEPCLHLGIALCRTGDYENSILPLETFLGSCPSYMEWGIPYAINKLTWSYLNTGRNAEVVQLLGPLLAQGENLPENFQSLRPHMHKTLGCSHYVLGNKNECLENLKIAISLSHDEMKNDALIQDIFKEYGYDYQ